MEHSGKMSAREHQPRDAKMKRSKAPVFLVLLAVGLFVGAWMLRTQYVEQVEFLEGVRQKISQAVNVDVVYEGVSVDGISLSGLTRGEMLTKLKQREEAFRQRVDLAVTYEGREYPITAEDVNYSFNTQEVIDKAWAIARTGTTEERYAQIEALKSNPVELKFEATPDVARITNASHRIAATFERAPVNADIDGFDKDTKTFNFSPESAGSKANGDKLAADLLLAVQKNDLAARVAVSVSPVEPEVTTAMLDGKFGLMATFTTETTKVEARNNNIRLAAGSFNGKMVLPGEEFSANASTGPRTPETGYQEAGAYRDGKVVPEPGGGVCQVSSTLFNTLVRAGLEVTERNSHSMPVSYVPLGHDAAIDQTTKKDLKFVNNTGYPIFMFSHFESRKLTIEIYGYLLNEKGVTHDLEAVVTQVIEPGPATYLIDMSLEPGKVVTDREEKKGQKVDTYLLTFKDGVQISREKKWFSNYSMVTGIYNIGPSLDAMGRPVLTTPTPKPTVKPTATPKPSSTPRR